MGKRKLGLIPPMYVEPNRKMKNFMKVAKYPKTIREYKDLMKSLKASPRNFSKKLREYTWKGKTVADIEKELAG
ncbi:MAG: hypothetical protein HYT70_00735 [Candidatus Aenigmarchaeota archaeon]|nr:hypothetical protein [Candidatus Aenigmarchaeota archaeon]